ncbi:MAG: glycosyltransferase family 61 protein, partial [Gemmatimonadaceae bacterium]|nr:glycosyltransferase family 61 protein [Acetobacteraceae bacterium]
MTPRLQRHPAIPHTVELLVPGRSYRSAGPPRLFGYATQDPGILSWLPDELQRTAITCPDEYVIRLPRVYVVHGHYLFLSPDAALADTFDFDPERAGRPDMAEAATQIAAGEVAAHPAGGLPVFHLFKDIYYNYGHLLVEVLPKLLHIRRLGIDRFSLLYPWSALAYLPIVQHVATVLGLGFEPVVCYNNQIMQADDVHWVGPVARHDRRKSQTLAELARCLTAVDPAEGGPRRLYVTRPPNALRPIPNHGALETLARSAGYEVVDPAALSFPDQVRLFHGADHVIGPMGAALSNTVFMRPGTRVTMLTTRRVDPFYWDIARLIGL